MAITLRSTRLSQALPTVLQSGWRSLVILAVDAATIVAAGWILWSTAGSTVVNGTIIGQVGFLFAMICGVAIRTFLRNRLASPSAPRPALEMAAAVGQLAALTVLFILWRGTGLYYYGWLATLAGIVLLVSSLLRFLRAVTAPGKRDDGRLHPTAVPGFGILTGLAVLVATSAVHNWDAGIINGLILLIGFATLIGVAAAHLLSRVRTRSDARPERPSSRSQKPSS